MAPSNRMQEESLNELFGNSQNDLTVTTLPTTASFKALPLGTDVRISSKKYDEDSSRFMTPQGSPPGTPPGSSKNSARAVTADLNYDDEIKPLLGNYKPAQNKSEEKGFLGSFLSSLFGSKGGKRRTMKAKKYLKNNRKKTLRKNNKKTLRKTIRKNKKTRKSKH